MEWNQRLAAVRKAAGLTQEQLGELVGVTRQAVSKWESAQTVPDALMIAEVCRCLHVSADYVLLGRQPEEEGRPAEGRFPDTCPCCGRETAGDMCPSCGYALPPVPAVQGPLYAVVGSLSGPIRRADHVSQLMKYCGLTSEEIDGLNEAFQCVYPHSQTVFCRGRNARAAQWIAAHLDREFLPRIVKDKGEELDLLRVKPRDLDVLPLEREKSGGLGFWGTVGAVILGVIGALLLFSLF